MVRRVREEKKGWVGKDEGGEGVVRRVEDGGREEGATKGMW